MSSGRFKEDVKDLDPSLLFDERPFLGLCPFSILEALKDAGVQITFDEDLIRAAEAKYPSTRNRGRAIFAYTWEDKSDIKNSLYKKVNTVLATRNDSDLFKVKKYVLHLLAALRKLPPYTETRVLYRAVRNISERARTPEEVLKWAAFTSTTSNEEQAYEFFNCFKTWEETDAKYIFEITGYFRNAHDISAFSNFSDEKGKTTTLLDNLSFSQSLYFRGSL